MSVRRCALSGKRRSGARRELPLWHVPPHLRRSLHDLRPFPGEPFAWTAPPTHYRSSADAERGFCPICGCTLSMRETVLPDRVQVSLGSLDRPDLVKPDDHVWTSSQLPWLEVVDDLPRFATISDAVPRAPLGGDDERASASAIQP